MVLTNKEVIWMKRVMVRVDNRMRKEVSCMAMEAKNSTLQTSNQERVSGESTHLATVTDVPISKRAKRSKRSLPFTFTHYSAPHEWHLDRNDDMVLVDAPRGLAAVFDGVGYGPGYLASTMAAKMVRQRWRLAHAASSLPKIHSETDWEELDTEVSRLLMEASLAIYEEGERLTRHLSDLEEKERHFPSTTVALVVLCYQPEKERYLLTCAHVGDSRIYLLPKTGDLRRLTDDDGLLSLRLKDGSISRDEAVRIDQATSLEQLNEIERSYFSWRNGITQSLGDLKIDVHIGHTEVVPGDCILLCSDGIHDNLTDLELAKLLRMGKRTTVARLLVQRAIERSHEDDNVTIRAKKDDMSAIVITYNEGPTKGMASKGD
jgi:serine/threonine protein phosphatase PrpC